MAKTTKKPEVVETVVVENGAIETPVVEFNLFTADPSTLSKEQLVVRYESNVAERKRLAEENKTLCELYKSANAVAKKSTAEAKIAALQAKLAALQNPSVAEAPVATETPTVETTEAIAG